MKYETIPDIPLTVHGKYLRMKTVFFRVMPQFNLERTSQKVSDYLNPDSSHLPTIAFS